MITQKILKGFTYLKIDLNFKDFAEFFSRDKEYTPINSKGNYKTEKLTTHKPTPINKIVFLLQTRTAKNILSTRRDRKDLQI